ncbi:MAG TPA: NTP transferase domain-containing protein [Acidimicrobiales bacterium]|nr:NTP transferase domain-containing protein [Acidimicrobiales bacterium]
MQCVILAGGLGTRMRQVAGDLPKALIPVNGVPFASHQLSWLAGQGVSEIVYSVGHRGEMIRSYVGDGSQWGVRARYLDDGPTLLGTGGALRKGLDEGLIESPFITLYGDSFLPVAYPPVVEAFFSGGLPALMTVYRNADAWVPSNAIYSEGIVRLYDKRPEHKSPDMAHIDYGLSVLTAGPLEEMVEPGRPADLSDVFHLLSLSGRLAGHDVTERFFEVGSPAGLADLERHLTTPPQPGQSLA